MRKSRSDREFESSRGGAGRTKVAIKVVAKRFREEAVEGVQDLQNKHAKGFSFSRQK